MLTFYFSGAEGHMAVPEVLTAGMVGKELRLEFSVEWEDLTKTVVFSNGETTLDRLYTGGTMVIPAQVLEKPLKNLTVGLYGVSADGTLVIPTVRAMGPEILPGVEPAEDPGMDPSLPIWNQLLIMVGQLEDLSTDEKSSLVAAVNELAERTERNDTTDYYGSLSDAVLDINSGAVANALDKREGAKVSVFTAHTGAKTVMLHEDISESDAITISKDMDLVLNGKKLNLTTETAVMTFAVGTKCRIYGDVPGSAINMEGVTSNNKIWMLNVGSELFEIYGGSYTINIAAGRTIVLAALPECGVCRVHNAVLKSTNLTSGGIARCVQVQAKGSVDLENTDMEARGSGSTHVLYSVSKLNVENCVIKAVSTNVAYAGAFYAGSVMHMKNTTFHADSPGCHAGTDNWAIGLKLMTDSEVHLENCVGFATHAAVETGGRLYINGGSYTGYSHGGIYAASQDDTFINDAVIMCGNYVGEFDYTDKQDDILGCFYFGGGPDANYLTAYIDGCTFASGTGKPGIVVRGTSGEHDNSLYISNSIVEGHVRVDHDTHRVYVGRGTNLSNIKFDYPGRAEFTEQLYRKNSGKKYLRGTDYEALANWMEAAPGVVKRVGGVAADSSGNVPLEWVAGKSFQPGVLLEEGTVTAGISRDLTYEMLEGQEELAILCDGRLYLCTPEFDYDAVDGYFVHLGNRHIGYDVYPDTGEPFLFSGFKGVGALLVEFAEGDTHTMSVTGYVYDYTKLPDHYLPVEAIRNIVTDVLAELQSG